MSGVSLWARYARFLSSSVGSKVLIALTGLLLFAYLVLHLAGNVLVFGGRDLFNSYSHTLISNPLILPIELALLLVFVIHIYKTVQNLAANRAARPVAYAKKQLAGHTSRKSLSSSTMIASGVLVALFVVVHVKQFKFGSYYETAGDMPVRDLYRTEVEVFQQPLWVAFYVLATLLVVLHLRHGIASGLQSLGLDHPLYTRWVTAVSLLLAILIGGGLGIIPVWVYLTQ